MCVCVGWDRFWIRWPGKQDILLRISHLMKGLNRACGHIGGKNFSGSENSQCKGPAVALACLQNNDEGSGYRKESLRTERKDARSELNSYPPPRVYTLLFILNPAARAIL